MATEVTRTLSPGQHSNRVETPSSSPHEILSGLSKVYQRLHGTSITSFPDGGEEKGVVEGFASLEAEIKGLHDRAQALSLDRQALLDRVRDMENKNKQLVEKNKKFLEKNIELTALNRNLKDGNHLLQQNHKKMQEDAEEARQRLCSLARELQREKGHSLELEDQVLCIEELKKQLAEQDSSITALRQACSEKDRRIELIQHRKKRRRLIRSQEKCPGVKETFYGYDEDENDQSVDSENSLSLSSVSVSTLSEEDGCDELSREELERSHRQMLREHLQLERSHALLQAHTGSSQDPHREIQTRSQLQADLFSAQCRIELLEKEIRSLQKRKSSGGGGGGGSDADVQALLNEREELKASRSSLALKLEQVDTECVRLRQELRMAAERAEDLEFRILELEELRTGDDHVASEEAEAPEEDERHSPDLEEDHGGGMDDDVSGDVSEDVCGDKDLGEEVTECVEKAADQLSLQSPAPCSTSPAELPALGDTVAMEVERLRRELTAALKGRGLEADTILKRLEDLKDAEEKVAALEQMARELQSKVITLQQERDDLQERLLRGAPVSLVAEVERRQNLELKVEFLEKVEAQSSQRINELEAVERSLREQLDSRASPSGSNDRAQVLQEKLAAMEKENRTLNDRISELEENEEILRENWRRVADEDANRTQTLEEKVKVLEHMNKQLKVKLSEAQDFVVINTGPAQGSLADELSASKRKAAKTHSGGPLSPGASDEDSGDEDAVTSVKKLKRQLSLVEEEKNSKIASLQEKVAQLHENEIKLSETLAEMEMTERELRAKLALYESSEVEMKGLKQKELKGAARIRELEKQETEMSEKITKQEEKENSLYVRISSLMDQLKDYKKKVEDLESELAEKEKRCARVGSLENKLRQIEEAYREKMVMLENSLAEKEDQLAAEHEQHEEDSRSLNEKIASLEETLQSKDKEHNNRVYILEEMFAQKEKGFSDKISSLERDLSERHKSISSLESEAADRDGHIAELEKDLGEKDSRISHLKKELANRDSQISDLENQLADKDSEVSDQLEQLRHELASKDSHTGQMEERLIEMSTNISQLQTQVAEKDAIVDSLKSQLSDRELEYSQRVSQLQSQMEEKDRVFEERLVFMENELEAAKQELSQHKEADSVCSGEISAVRSQLEEKSAALVSLQERVEKTESETNTQVSQLQSQLSEKDTTFEAQLREKEESFASQLRAKDLEQKASVGAVETECEALRSELTEKDLVIEKLESTKNELLSKLEIFKDREEELLATISALETDAQNLQSQKEVELRDVTSSLQSKLLEAETQKEQTQQKLSSAETQLLSSTQRVEEHAAHISQLESQLTQAQEEAGVLRQRLDELEDKERVSATKAESLLQQEVMLKARVSEVESQLEVSARNQDQQTASVSELALRKNELEAALSQLKSDLSQSQAENAELQERVSELTTQTESLKEEVADLKAECDRCQSLEIRLREKLDKERSHGKELEEEISILKQAKQEESEHIAELQGEISRLQQIVTSLEGKISRLEQSEEELKSQIAAEQESKAALDRQSSEVSEDAKVKSDRISQLELLLQESKTQVDDKSSRIDHLEKTNLDLLNKIEALERTVSEKNDELEREKSDMLSKWKQLEMDNQAAAGAVEKEKELLTSSQQREKTLQEREKTLEDKVSSLEARVARQQEDHSQMCLKLQHLEQREKELMEQITDIEQTVIIPLEAENSDLKEEVTSIRQQNQALNLQLDKQEERAQDDSEEIEGLRKSLNELQLSHSDVKSRLEIVSQEMSKLELENENLKVELIDAEAANKSLEEQLENNRAELKETELCDRDMQTDSDVEVSSQVKTLQSKLTVLEDAESRFMSRIMDLEEREQQLSEELESVRQTAQEKELCDKDVDTSDLVTPTTGGTKKPESNDIAVDTEDLQEQTTTKVSELFGRVQELETANQRLMSSLEQASAGEADRKQLAEKLQLLEQSEDRLMERVMELEENEVTLRTQVERSRKRAEIADELEEEISVMLQQEDEWKEKVATLSEENSALSAKVAALESQCVEEQSKSKSLSDKLNTDQQHLLEVQKELKASQSKLDEYEEKLSTMEESEKQVKDQLSAESQRESELQKEMQVLREDMNDLCERYKELEQENSQLKQQHSKVLSELKEAESRCLELAGGVVEPTVQAVKSESQLYVVPQGGSVSKPQDSSSDQQPPQCSNMSVELVQSSLQTGAQSMTLDQQAVLREQSLLTRISQLESELSSLKSAGAQNGKSSADTGGVSSGTEKLSVDLRQSLSGGAHSPSTPVQPVKILNLHDALQENSSLRAQLQDLQSRMSAQVASDSYSPDSTSREGLETLQTENSQLQAEVSRLQAHVQELENALTGAEETVQDVRTVVKTKCVRTLQQKIETVQRTIRTQKGPASSLQQQLLELLTSQAELQEELARLTQSEQSLRSSLKTAEEELSKLKSSVASAPTSVPSARRLETERRLSVQSRLRLGGPSPLTSLRGRSASDRDADTRAPSEGNKEREEWLERQISDLQFSKSSLERRLHEAERRLAFRPRSTNASRDELQFRVDQLQGEQTELKKKIEDLEALNSHYLKEKVELAQEKEALEKRIKESSQPVRKDVGITFLREEPLGSSGTGSEGESESAAMLEKPEDVLQNRIKELEHLEKHLRQQLNEVEADRDQLHEIARKDKAMIHEQNVRLRELMLQERNLRMQVTGLEDSERSLYNRCGELEDTVARLEDRVHELEVHERRLRELVRKLKLDEEVWLNKSGDLTSSMEQLSASEGTLRKMVQDLQIEKGGLADRAEYLEARVKELENLEATMMQRLKNYENVEASLQSRLQHMENSEAAAYSKASELDVINMDLSARLQRAVEENAVLSQHVAQQQGQIHELDRKLSTAIDAEVSLSQHVESVQKNETSLQKKVREYELRDIDAQARIRELEQTEEILKDKVNQLQRSENRLKSRLVEFESVGSQVMETLPPAQKQQLPQKLEECQKRIIVLQRQLETAQAQLQRPQTAEGDATVVKVPATAYNEMRSKVALLEETEYHLDEIEKLNKQLNDNIVQLRQGKGSCGHEVEVEVLRRRINSYQNFTQKMKHHLSEEQVPSLWASDPGQGQGPESEDLPARSLQSLESERVLHSVRSLTKPHGPPHTEEEIIPSESSSQLSRRPQGVAVTSSGPEESHWRTIELRHRAQQGLAEQRGASATAAVSAAATMPQASAHPALAAQEELVIGLSLPSESERSFKSQNDTDSELSGAPLGLRVAGVTQQQRFPSTVGGTTPASVGGEAKSPPLPSSAWPPPSPRQQASGFTTDDSLYLPSSAQEGSDSLEEDEAPPLPTSAPPGAVGPAPSTGTVSPTGGKTFVSKVTMASVGQNSSGATAPVAQPRASSVGTGQGAQKVKLQTTSAVGLSIRQRIAQIERQLQELPGAKAGGSADDEDLFALKAKAAESARLLGLAERENKQLKDDINRLEKDMEEKRRYFDIFEKWIVDAEEILKNKNKKNDRDIVQQLQTELKHLKQDLGNSGYRKDDIYSDPAALKTELDRRDRELNAKRTEMDGLVEELQKWRSECSNIEVMRRNALDSLRCLETEVAQLQDADVQLKQMKDEYNTLRGQYDELDVQKNKAVIAVHSLRAKVARLAKKCQEKDELLRRMAEETRGGGRRSSSLIEELTRLEAQAGGEEYNRPLSPLDLVIGPVLSDTDRLLAERIPQSSFTRWPSTSSLGDPHDFNSDREFIPGGQRAVLQRPRSADETSHRRGQHPGLTISHSAPVSSVVGTMCVAIVDYTPDAASRSGHPHLELALKEGDQVRMRGPVDRHGYCEAEVRGRIGLVPASHLYPLTDGAATHRTSHGPHRHSRHKNVGGDSPEQIVKMFDELQDPRILPASAQNHSQHTSHSSGTQTQQPRPRRSAAKTHAPPEAPTDLRVEDVEGNSLVLAWQPPVLDQHGCSNGSKVVGYRIYLNGRVCQQPHSPRLSRTRVEGVRHDRPQHLAIQTLAASGQVSARVELVYQGVTSPSLNQNGGDGEGDTDLSSILNSIHYKTGRKQTVMGLYDYDPDKQSPGDYTACELAFHAGDIMFVYGEERTDGFFHGERNGQRGLIPACFVEPVQPGPRSTQKIQSANGQTSPRS